MRKILTLVSSLILICGSLLAQSPPKQIILIKAGRLIDVRAGRVLTDQAILIEGDRIKEGRSVGDGSSHAPQARE